MFAEPSAEGGLMQRYENYKPSGVKWIQQIPAHWEIRANRTLFRERNEPGNFVLPILSVSLHSGVSDSENGDVDDARTRNRIADRSSYKRVRQGDVAYNMMRAWQGAIGAVRTEGMVSPAYVVAAPRLAINGDYFEYQYRTAAVIREMDRFSKGITDFRKRLYWNEFKQLSTIVPPREEQDRIVEFLDQKIAEIDTAISKKEKLIELLQEQKRILIEQAVTLGLNRDVSMSDSAVPAIGKIPRNWSLRKLKHVCSYQEGPGIMAADFRSEGVPLVRIAGIKDDVVTLDGCNYLHESKVGQRWAHFRLNAGDLVISGSASSGTVSEVTEVAAGAVPYTGLFRMIPDPILLSKEFVKLYFSSRSFNEQMSLFKTGVGLQHFGPSHLARVWIAVPPLNEQEAITSTVRTNIFHLDLTSNSIRRSIIKLAEAKASLISTVITGNIKI
jgi:type I restriction enzyme S subunit